MKKLNERIKIIRKSAKLTQNQFGEKLGVSGSYVSRLESGKEQPTEMLLKLIALTFDISTEWLNNGVGNIRATKSQYDYFEKMDNEEYIKELNYTLDDIKTFVNNTPEFPISFFYLQLS